MLGFLFGTLCLVALIAVVRAGRCAPRARRGCARGCGGGWHGGWDGWHGPGPWHRHRHQWSRRGGRRGWWLRRLFEELDTSPGQEKVIGQAVEEVFAATRALRRELDDARRELASALRSGEVAETRMGELFARHDESLRAVREAMLGALARASGVLDEDQRRQLADWIEGGLGGPWARFGGGPYRAPGRGPGGGWA